MPTLVVNTTSDQNNGIADGVISLRDAILEANANPNAEYIIELDAGQTYLLTKDGSDEDAAQTGDLDITGDVTIWVETGEAATIDASGFDMAEDPDRVFDVLSNGSLTLENVTVTGGALSSSAGGGILVRSEATLTLTNTTISGNSAEFGGGIFNYYGTVTIANSTISGNSAEFGGGIDNRGTATISDSTISSNSAEFGGGIDNSSTATLTNSTISGNSANFSGGGISNNSGTATITNSTISGNSANSFGGGINNNSGTATIANSTISGNSAEDGGGGIDNRGTATITNSTISENSANSFGGGIVNSSTATITNSTISGNSANSFGGGIDNSGTANLTNSTITNNIADQDADGLGDGGGIFNSPNNTLALQNTIVAGNFDNSPPDSGNIHLDLSGEISTSSFNLIGNSTGVTGLGDNDITNVDPLIGPLQDNGGPTQTHVLLLDSPAIDAGNNSLVPEDEQDLDGDENTTEPIPVEQRGFARFNETVDIGAVEFGDSVVTTPVNLSIIPIAGTEAGGTEFTITVTADSAVTGDQTVDLALRGDADANDFTEAIPNHITIPDGQTSWSVKLTVNDDSEVEGTENASFILSNPSEGLTLGGTTSVDLTIEDNDPSQEVSKVLNLGTLGNDQFNLPDSTNEELVFGGTGDDTIDAAAAKTPQVDRFYGGSNNDELLAGENDRLFGGSGSDVLDARTGDGNNRLFGGDGADTLFGGSNDLLSGGDGDDILTGGGDSNLMIGGDGADTFIIGSPGDTIFDFETGIDKFDIDINGESLSLNDLDITKAGGNTRISFNDNTLVTLIGDDFELKAEDFV